MSAALDKLRQEVAENTAAVASAEQLISGLAQQLRDAIGDEAALQALADELDANSNRLAAAVASNTPASEDDGADLDETVAEDEVTEDEVVSENTPTANTTTESGEAQTEGQPS